MITETEVHHQTEMEITGMVMAMVMEVKHLVQLTVHQAMGTEAHTGQVLIMDHPQTETETVEHTDPVPLPDLQVMEMEVHTDPVTVTDHQVMETVVHTDPVLLTDHQVMEMVVRKDPVALTDRQTVGTEMGVVVRIGLQI